jgi:hypothetical protein
MFRTFLIGVAGFVAAGIVTYLVIVVGTELVWEVLDVHDQDGGGCMALGLVIGPFFAVIGGLAGAFFLPAWATRRRGAVPPQSDKDRARNSYRFLILGGTMLGAFLGYQAAQFCFWLVSPILFDSIWKVRAVSWLPTIAVLFGALAGGIWTRRVMRRSLPHPFEPKV